MKTKNKFKKFLTFYSKIINKIDFLQKPKENLTYNQILENEKILEKEINNYNIFFNKNIKEISTKKTLIELLYNLDFLESIIIFIRKKNWKNLENEIKKLDKKEILKLTKEFFKIIINYLKQEKTNTILKLLKKFNN